MLKELYHITKKTAKEVNLFECYCSICERIKTKIVSDNTIDAKGLQNFFENLGSGRAKAAKTLLSKQLTFQLGR